jgi:transposase-like protein
MAKHVRNRSKEQFWRRAVARWRRSGQSVRAYCVQEGLSEPSFYAWRRELARRDRHAEQTATSTTSASFVPVRVVSEPSAAIEIVLSKGPIVRVRPGFDATTLRQVLATVEAAIAVAEDRPC